MVSESISHLFERCLHGTFAEHDPRDDSGIRSLLSGMNEIELGISQAEGQSVKSALASLILSMRAEGPLIW